jgi:hypothetical protein
VDFPKYVVEVDEREDGSPSVAIVTWVNGLTQNIPTQHATLLDIFDEMAPIAQDMQRAEEDKEMM